MIVINEIHYEPVENILREEFVEVYNSGPEEVDLSSWMIRGGIDYTFPQGTTLTVGDFLIIAESPEVIFSNYAVNAVGAYIGKLANEGELLELFNSHSELQDRVDYQVGFPWPLASAGDGKSMSLLNPALDNDLGGSWRAADPTPGQVNSNFADNAPPQIRQVSHTPSQPHQDQPIVVTAKVTDPNGMDFVSLLYQVVPPGNYVPAVMPLTISQLLQNADQPRTANAAFEDKNNWTFVAMNDNATAGDEQASDGIYTGIIPGQVNRSLVRYRLLCADAHLPAATIQVPYPDDLSLNFACFVYDGVPPYQPTDRTVHPEGLGHVYSATVMNSLPVYHLITRAADLSQCIAYNTNYQIPKTNKNARDCFNWEGTFVYDGIVYDHIHYRLRGYNQRYQLQQKRNMRFRFNRGKYFQASDQQGNIYPTEWRTLNTAKMFGPRDDGNYGLAETMNNFLFNMVGVPAPYVHTFHFRVIDGVDEAPLGSGGQYIGDFWGMALAMEDYDSNFLDAHNLPKGNLYKLKDGETNGKEEQRYQSPDGVSDAEDHKNIVAKLHHTSSSEWLEKYIDYDLWYRYETVQQAIRHYDIGMYPEQENRTAPVDTDAGKNLTWYFFPSSDTPFGKLWHLPWDTEQSWGPNGAHQGWDMALVAIIDPTVKDGKAPLNYTGGVNVKPELYLGYRNFIREFRNLIFNEEVLTPMIDRFASIITNFVPADRDRWKNHPLGGTTKTDFGPLENVVTDMKTFAFVGGTHWPVADRPNTSRVAPGGRAVELDQRSNYEGDAASIPYTATITYTGPPEIPIDQLTFTTTPFVDPQGTGTFGAMKWRCAEVSDSSSGFSFSNQDYPYEWNASWISSEISPFTAGIVIPPTAVEVGHSYRVRVRMMDNTGRWGHWSQPIRFIPQLKAVATPGEIIITEIFTDTSGPDDNKEWFEVFNTTDHEIDMTGWTLSDNDTDLHTIASANPVLVPPKGYLVLGQSTSAVLNGGTPVGYSYGTTITLGNNGDEIILMAGQTVIHSIGYGTYDPTPKQIQTVIPTAPAQGISLGMSQDYCNAPVTSWVSQTTVYGTLGNKGTPGNHNSGVGVCQTDLSPPVFLEANYVRGDLVFLRFNESLDPTSVSPLNHYSVNQSAGQPIDATLITTDTVQLRFADRLTSGITYTFTVQGIADMHGNVMQSSQQRNASFQIPPISITEIMYDNRGNDIEWIELFNTTQQIIDLSNWYLTDDNHYPAEAEGSMTLPQGTLINPGEYLIVNLWDAPNFNLWQMPPSIRIINASLGVVGSLSNSGDNLALYNRPTGGSIVDGGLSFGYPNISTDGQSIEKIDELFPWLESALVTYNLRKSETPIGFTTSLNENGAVLSEYASPGRKNGTLLQPTPTPTYSSTTTSSPTNTPTLTATTTYTLSFTETPEPTPSATFTQSFTFTNTATTTPTPTYTMTITATLTTVPTETPSLTSTSTLTTTPSSTITGTITETETTSSTPTIPPEVTETSTPQATATATLTPTTSTLSPSGLLELLQNIYHGNDPIESLFIRSTNWYRQ